MLLTILALKAWHAILIGVAGLLVGLVVGFFVSRVVFKKYLEKNPPINENTVRAMMSSMGRVPSEKQVRQVMKSLNQGK